MNKELEYLPYRSRRNKIIKNNDSLNLIDYYSYDRQKEFILNTKKKFGSWAFRLNEMKKNHSLRK